MFHLTDDDCERYALHQVTGEALEQHEKHLLICEACQARQGQIDDYVAHMKRALSDQDTPS